MSTETKKPRTIKRGDDDIELDKLANAAVEELNWRLARSAYNDEEKKAILNDFTKLLKGLYDDTVVYAMEGGFNNKIGLSGPTKKGDFNSAGKAASVLGDVIRSMTAYLTPVIELPKDSRISYNNRSTIGDLFDRYIFGDTPNPEINYFLYKDPKDSEGKRSNTERIKLITNFLNEMSDSKNWDKYMKDYDESFDEWIADLNTLKTDETDKTKIVLDPNNNGLIDENEVLILSKLLGKTDLDRYLYTGEYLPDSTTPFNDPNKKNYTNENDFLDHFYPKSTKSPLYARTLDLLAMYTQDSIKKLENGLSTLNVDELLSFLKGMLSNPKLDYNNTKTMLRILNNRRASFTNDFILSKVLERLRTMGALKQFSDDDNRYFIPFDSPKLDEYRTGYVYSIDANGNHTILEMDRRYIPYYTNIWHNEFINQLPSTK